MKNKRLCLIDGSGFLFRAYYGVKAQMTRLDGTPTNAVYGFIQMLLKVRDDIRSDYIAVIFDKARRTFRNDIYSEYKAHRPPPPDDLVPQFQLVREATVAMNIAMVDMDGFEADDLIATYARMAVEAGAEVTIVSTDKDLMQVVGARVKMFDAMKNIEIGTDEVVKKFGVGPDKVVDVQALAGDSSDNIPGVQGIGIKTAALLINEYGGLEEVLNNASQVKQPKRQQALIEQADLARLSLQLVTLRNDVPVERSLGEFLAKEIDNKKFIKFLEEQNFRSIITKLSTASIQVISESIGNDSAVREKKGSNHLSDSPGSEGIVLSQKYQLVTDLNVLGRFLDEAMKVGVLVVDTETNSLDSMSADLVGISLSIVAGSAAYIPVGHQRADNQTNLDLLDQGEQVPSKSETPMQIPIQKVIAELKPILESPSVIKVGHNIKYDIKVLSRYGINIAPIDDTMILSYVLDGSKNGHGMDELSSLHLKHETIKFKEVAGSGKSQVTFDKVSLDKALDYAAEDADITGRLYNILRPRIIREKSMALYEGMERPLVYILADMEKSGIRVDAKFLKYLSKDFAERLAHLELEIHKLAGREFNIASPKQLGEVLFDEIGLPGGKKGKTGAYGTGAEVLEGLASNGHDFPQKVLDWRQLAKLKSTYTDALVGQINKDTGRVHTNFGQAVASTGRLSSNDPNLQNIPIRTEEGRKIRQAFIPSKGHVLLSADYSQIELRLLAHVADISALKDAFNNGVDIHTLTASQVFGIPVKDMDPMIRRQAKAINFGIIYGISAFGLSRQLRISRGEANNYIEAYFENYPGIRSYMESSKQSAREDGFVKTLYGRKCFFPGISDRNPNRRNFMERAAINAPIQGGAADIIKRAMIKLEFELKKAGLRTKMLLQVHDELIFDVPEKELKTAVEVIKSVMENSSQLSIPLVVDTGWGMNWDEAH
ncbi:MAG: DNA polymerase I [Pseudomonadota bacterium]|nr:DNA polymerase I [Pseudomonadota bacterium]